jgi:hypothetical protein
VSIYPSVHRRSKNRKLSPCCEKAAAPRRHPVSTEFGSGAQNKKRWNSRVLWYGASLRHSAVSEAQKGYLRFHICLLPTDEACVGAGSASCSEFTCWSNRAYKVKPASERSVNTTDTLHVCVCYGRYGALLTLHKEFLEPSACWP